MALENLWFPLTHLLIFFVLVDLIQSGREKLLTETTMLLAALVVLLAGFQFISWYFGGGLNPSGVGWAAVFNPQMPFPLTSPRLFVPIGVSTWLAAFTAPLVIVAFAWGKSTSRRAARNALWSLSLLLFVVMLMTGSRGGWISLVSGGSAFILLTTFQNDRFRELMQRFALPIAAVVIASVVLGGLLFLRSSADPRHAAGDMLRFDLWRGALAITSQHPFLGVGPGLFGSAYRLVRDPFYVDNRLGTAHNTYLNILAENGVSGLLVALALALVLVHTWRKLWRSAEIPARKMHLAGAFAALVGFGAHSFFDTFTSTPLVLLALSLAAYCVTAARSRLDPPIKGDVPAAIISLVLIVIFAIGLFRSDQAHASFNASLTGTLEVAKEAAALDPGINLYPLQVAYLTDTSDLTQAISAYQKALDLEPTWDTGWINLAALYERKGEILQSLDALKNAIDIDHQNGAQLLWARVAESYGAAQPEMIRDMYYQALRSGGLEPLPLSVFWSATELRRQALEVRIAEYSLEGQYRILRIHDPVRAAALVPVHPTTAQGFWVSGEFALTERNDQRAAFQAFSQAIALNPSGDYYASRARTQTDSQSRDLILAQLLGTYYESPNAIRARLTDDPQERMRLLAAAVPPRVIQQNYEGVRFAGRVASFDVLPEMRLPGPGRSVMQPWYDLAALYLSLNQPDRAVSVYRAIIERSPEDQEAREQLAQLTESNTG